MTECEDAYEEESEPYMTLYNHGPKCKCRDCEDQRGDEEYQRRKDEALCPN